MVLLHVMAKLELSPVAVHFNHKLREEADQEAVFAQEFAQSLGIPFYLGSEGVSDYADNYKLSIEEAARDLRYQFLFQTAAELGAGAVVVAHHADDQVETILMNLLRGAGMTGLLGMQVMSLPTPWSESIPLVRPLLNVWKDQILYYLKDQQLHPIQDPSNLDLGYQRNKIRHQLIPLLEELTPGFRYRLLQTAEILSGDEEALNVQTRRIWKECLEEEYPDRIQLNAGCFSEQPLGIQRRLIRKALRQLRPDYRELSFQQVTRALALIQNQAPGLVNWVAKVNLAYSQERILFSTWESEQESDRFPQLVEEEVIHCPIEGEISIGRGWFFSVQPLTIPLLQPEKMEFPEDDYQVWVDQRVMGEETVLRRRRKGDVFSPLGMGGKSMKVSDLMINEKIPAINRDRWPVLATGETILWIPGVRVGHAARITEKTKGGLQLTVYKKG
jgi:tRNA(Ile)-lysidine synthase